MKQKIENLNDLVKSLLKDCTAHSSLHFKVVFPDENNVPSVTYKINSKLLPQMVKGLEKDNNNAGMD